MKSSAAAAGGTPRQANRTPSPAKHVRLNDEQKSLPSNSLLEDCAEFSHVRLDSLAFDLHRLSYASERVITLKTSRVETCRVIDENELLKLENAMWKPIRRGSTSSNAVEFRWIQ